MAVGLLIGGKVGFSPLLVRALLTHLITQLLNVQVPFFFKDIIDTMNIPIDPTTSNGVLSIAGTVIIGCKGLMEPNGAITGLLLILSPSSRRRTRACWSWVILRTSKRRLCQCRSRRDPEGRARGVFSLAELGCWFPFDEADRRTDASYRSRNEVRRKPRKQRAELTVAFQRYLLLVEFDRVPCGADSTRDLHGLRYSRERVTQHRNSADP